LIDEAACDLIVPGVDQPQEDLEIGSAAPANASALELDTA